jgi:hypothetical protein
MEIKITNEDEAGISHIGPHNGNVSSERSLNFRHVRTRKPKIVRAIHKTRFDTPGIPDPQAHAPTRHLNIHKIRHRPRGGGSQGAKRAIISLKEKPPVH